MGLTIGLVGLGRIGAFHASTLTGLPDVDSLVVTDAVPAAMDTTKARFPTVRPAADADAVLASGVDAVVIASATPTHAELIEKAVAAGVPVFCEKPIALSVADSAEVVRRISGADVPVQIGYNRRFDPAMAAARAAVVSGELGFITTVRSTTLDPAPPPPDYIAASGGIFRDCAVHDFDAVRWVLGDEVVEVYATGSGQGDPIFAEVGDLASASVLLSFASGSVGVVSVTRYNGRGYDCRLEVHGSADSVVAGWDEGTPVRNMQPGIDFPAGVPHSFFMDRFADAYRAELTAFCDMVIDKTPSPCTAADALEVAYIAEAATRSAGTGKPVRIDDIRTEITTDSTK
ncbi:Gfo/Idh/MocA family protein [Gordonia sp. NPDC003424]